MPKVSAIIPTWNRREQVRAAVDSVFAQTRPPDEVLVVDDGSTDGTYEGLSERFGDEARLRILRQENRGVSAARNVGIGAARGEWLAFLDSDDLWQPQKLAAQLAALERDPGYRVCHTGEMWIRNGRRVNPRRRHAKHGGWIFRQCLPLCAMSPSSILIHREVFAEVGTFDEDLPACEDYDLWLRITCRYPVLFVDRPLVIKYGGHPDQLSRTVPALDRYRIRALDKVLRSGALGPADRRAARRMLLEKIEIYGAGVRKRGRQQEWEELERLAARLTGGVPETTEVRD